MGVGGQEVGVRIGVDIEGLRSSAAEWRSLSSDAAEVRAAVELAVATAVVGCGHPLVGDQLDRLWARWGSALAARAADLEVLEVVVGAAADSYAQVDAMTARGFE